MRRNWLLVPAALAFLLLASCSSSEETQPSADTGGTTETAAEDAGPKVEDTVKAFYEHLNAGHQDAALALYTDTNRTAMSAPESGFAEWAKSETKEGTLQTVEVEPVTATGATVTVPFTLVYNDGTRAQRAVEAYRIGGTWMLGSVVER
jgi:hypothetical protein